MTEIALLFRTRHQVIFSVVLLIFCFAVTVFGVIPAVRKVEEVFGTIQELSSQITTLQRKRDALSRLDEITLRNQLTDVLSAVPADRSFPTLFETVERVAAQTGVGITNVSIKGGAALATPSGGAKASGVDKKLTARMIPFSVTVSGPLLGVEQFITVISGVRRLLGVRIFSMAFPEDDRPLTVVVEMDAFYEPLPTSLGSTRVDLPTLTTADEEVIANLRALPLVVQGAESFPPPLLGKVKDDPFSP